MKKYLKHIIPSVCVLLLLIVFKNWFSLDVITAGDMWPYSNAIYSSRSIIPYAWDVNIGNGMGMFVGPLLWIYVNFGTSITILGTKLGLSWNLIERIWYLFPFVIFSFYFSFRMFSRFFEKNNFAYLSSSIYTLNTYILMVIGGGQVAGIGMAYSLLPLILLSFFSVFENLENKEKALFRSVLAGLILSAQFIFDIRISYITLFAVFVLWIFNFYKDKNKFLNSGLFIFIIPGIIVFLLNAFWIIPTVLNGRNPVVEMGSAYSSLDAVKFFSFAKIEDAISLLHPNWPDNIFGKVDFLKPEFLFLPILAFFSMFFLKKETAEKRKILTFFTTLSLLGIFLSKGASEPFGNIYLWFFAHVPGFIMFRDSSKWYLLIAIGYSVLIPYSVQKIYLFLKTKTKFSYVFVIAVVIFLLFLIRPAILGNLSGAFKTTSEPKEYKTLEIYLDNQNNFFRTFWFPTIQRFGYYSKNHPAIPSSDLVKSPVFSDQVKFLHQKDAEEIFDDSNIKYLVVPYDSEKEIYLRDRKYSDALYKEHLKSVENIDWLKKINGFGKITVFENKNFKDHFFTDSKNLKLNYKYISPVEYIVNVENASRGDLIVFSDSFDAKWFARNTKNSKTDYKDLIGSNPYKGRLNSFTLRENGNYSLDVYYFPQIIVWKSTILSAAGLLLVLVFLIFRKINKK